jgi:nucleolar protein 14
MSNPSPNLNMNPAHQF